MSQVKRDAEAAAGVATAADGYRSWEKAREPPRGHFLNEVFEFGYWNTPQAVRLDSQPSPHGDGEESGPRTPKGEIAAAPGLTRLYTVVNVTDCRDLNEHGFFTVSIRKLQASMPAQRGLLR